MKTLSTFIIESIQDNIHLTFEELFNITINGGDMHTFCINHGVDKKVAKNIVDVITNHKKDIVCIKSSIIKETIGEDNYNKLLSKIISNKSSIVGDFKLLENNALLEQKSNSNLDPKDQKDEYSTEYKSIQSTLKQLNKDFSKVVFYKWIIGNKENSTSLIILYTEDTDVLKIINNI